MKRFLTSGCLLVSACLLLGCCPYPPCLHVAPCVVGHDSSNIVTIDGRKVFPIGMTTAPPYNSSIGSSAFAELHSAGVLFVRTGINIANTGWTQAAIDQEMEYEHAAACAGLYCQLYLGPQIVQKTSSANDTTITNVVNTFKANPGLGMWKGSDEPWWSNSNSNGANDSVAACQHVHDLIKSLDPDHAIWIVQAPRPNQDTPPFTSIINSLAAYYPSTGSPICDITGVDIYPVGYPPGGHQGANFPNKELSAVGDWTDIITQASRNTMPILMTLQVAFSGVNPPDHFLRFPEYTQLRFMSYYSIIHGAKGLQFFGPNDAPTLGGSDATNGWNWTYWNNVLKRLCQEIGDFSPLQPALVVPNAANNAGITIATSTIATGATAVADAKPTVEFVVREVGANDLYIIAARKEMPSNQATQATFSGIPSGFTQATVMYEDPAVANVTNSSFKYDFGPFDVHVFHFHK